MANRRLGVLAALVAAGVLTACGRSVDVSKLGASEGTAAQVADSAQKALDAFEHTVTGQRSGSPFATAIAANARALAVTDLSLRYVDAVTISDTDRQSYGPTAFAAHVAATYRIPSDPGPTNMEIGVVFKPSGAGSEVVALGGYGDRSALWLDGPATIRTSGRVTVIDASAETADRFVALGQSAIAAVGQVLPAWSGQLTIEVPANDAQLASVTQSSVGTAGDIAGITTSTDGTLNRTSPLHVFVNRRIFTGMSEIGGQVVMNHEATHVATLGPVTSMPTWMLEGFADFVALDHLGIPVDKAAGQELSRMRQSGIPDHLPTTEELAPNASGIGATYEEAWLAWRYLAATYGEPKAVAFYSTVSGGKSVDSAFTDVLGVTQAQFVAGWRANLRSLIG